MSGKKLRHGSCEPPAPRPRFIGNRLKGGVAVRALRASAPSDGRSIVPVRGPGANGEKLAPDGSGYILKKAALSGKFALRLDMLATVTCLPDANHATPAAVDFTVTLLPGMRSAWG